MKLKENYILKKIAGSNVVVPVRSAAVDFNAVIKLTDSAAFLWRMLEKGADREELVNALTDEYEVDTDRAAEDVDRFIKKLGEADVLD